MKSKKKSAGLTEPTGILARYLANETYKLIDKTEGELRDELIARRAESLIRHGEHVQGGHVRVEDKQRPKKEKVEFLYSNLRSVLGKNPPWEPFIDALKDTYPTEDWKDDTVNGWWKMLNKGKSILGGS